jgi:hypothetical protein
LHKGQTVSGLNFKINHRQCGSSWEEINGIPLGSLLQEEMREALFLGVE